MTAARIETRLAVAVGGFFFAVFAVAAIRRLLAGPSLTDFEIYRMGAMVAIAHGWGHLYDLSLQRDVFATLAPPGAPFMPFWNPPPLAWLLIPFTWLPVGAGYTLWVALEAAAWLGAAWLVAPRDRLGLLPHTLLLFGLFAVVFGLYEGQVDGILALAFAACWRLLERRSDVLAGVVLSATVVKPHPLLLLPLFLLAARRPRAAGGWAIGVMFLGLVSVLNVGAGGLATALADLRGGLAYALPGFTLAGLLGVGIAGWVARAIVLLGGLLAAFRLGRPGGALLLGVLVSLLTAQFLHTQDAALLLPALWVALGEEPIHTRRPLLWLAWVSIQLAPVLGLVLVVAGIGYIVLVLGRAIRLGAVHRSDEVPSTFTSPGGDRASPQSS